jgi:hypothetical protein
VATVEAATITVTSSADSGPGSLREAIYLAVTGDVIHFHPSLAGTPIVLTTGELLIDKDITITGLGQQQTILDGNHSSRVFRIESGASAVISDLTVRNGWPRECLQDGTTRSEGGGVYNAGQLVLDRARVTGNLVDHRNSRCSEYSDSPESIRGAGVCNVGTLDTHQTSIDANYAGGFWSYGGGLFNSGTANLTDSTFNGNSGEFDRGAGVYGAGIYNDQSGTARLVRCTVTNNHVAKGIENAGSLTVSDSVIASNGDWRGGALFSSGVATLKNTSITSNWSGVGAVGVITGSSFTLDGCTVAHNTGEYAGGVIGAEKIINSTIGNNEGYWLTGGVSGVGTLIASSVVGNISGHAFAGIVSGGSIKGSLIAGNYNFNDPDHTDCGGPIVSLGNNVLGEMSGCSGISDGANGDRVGVDWTLLFENGGSPYGRPIVNVADNGGPTPTVALLPDSPAIDTISPASCTDEHGNLITTDQRGVSRPQGPACDTGAFEFGQPRSAGFWSHQCGDQPYKQVSAEQLQALFTKVADSSSIFPECAPISCEALDPMIPKNDLRLRAKLGLLDLWLNLASGRQTRGRPISLPGLTSATTVTEALSELEMTVCQHLVTRAELANAVNIADALNNGVDDMELATTQSVVNVRPGTTTTITLGLINMSSGNRTYSLAASGPWPAGLSTTRVNALDAGEVAQVTATIRAPEDLRNLSAPIRFVATDLVSPGNLTRDLTIIFHLDASGPASGQPVVKPVRVE